MNLSPSTLKNTGEESSNLVMFTSNLNALSSILGDAILEELARTGKSRNLFGDPGNEVASHAIVNWFMSCATKSLLQGGK